MAVSVMLLLVPVHCRDKYCALLSIYFTLSCGYNVYVEYVI